MPGWLIGILATAIFGLIGLAWGTAISRIKKVEDCKMEKETCNLVHKQISESLAAITKFQAEQVKQTADMLLTLGVLKERSERAND